MDGASGLTEYTGDYEAHQYIHVPLLCFIDDLNVMGKFVISVKWYGNSYCMEQGENTQSICDAALKKGDFLADLFFFKKNVKTRIKK